MGNIKRKIKWGNYVAECHEGPRDLSEYDLGDETPWMCCDRDGLQIVVPVLAEACGELHSMQVGIDFSHMLRRYQDTFLSDGMDTVEAMEKEKQIAIKCLNEAIKFLSE